MHAEALRTSNESAFQRRGPNEGGDAGGDELVILLRIQDPGTVAGGRTNLVYCHWQQHFIWFLTNPVLFRVASKALFP